MTTTTIENTSKIIEAVIPCAAKLFRRYGYKKTTVDDIASGIHISKKTLYSVFPSKEEILRETIWRETLEGLRDFNKTIPPGAHPDIILLAFCRYIFIDRIKKGKIGSFWSLYVEDYDINMASLGALKRIIKDVYDQGKNNGLFKPVDSNLATEIIVNIIIIPIRDFHLYDNPLHICNDSLKMIADAVSYKNRIKVEAFV